jgi:phosphoribosylglycinamide formyltransferase-1
MLAGKKPDIIFAADKVKLNFYQSQIRTSPKDLYLHHPRDIAKHYNIDYKVVVHNSEQVAALVKERQLDLGIILGARILKPISFKNFKIGVLNMHPGLLPENRGLDNIKWAIVNNLAQGVTTHLIDEKIDKGLLLHKEQISIYKDDTLLDLQLRVQHLEQKLMLRSINTLEKNSNLELKKLGVGTYNKPMSPEVEETLLDLFEEYKKKNNCENNSTQ